PLHFAPFSVGFGPLAKLTLAGSGPGKPVNLVENARSVKLGARHAEIDGGEGGIRTHGPVARSTVFETAPFDRSGTSPVAASRRPRQRGLGGEGGIRTHGRVSPTHAFQACSLSHSDTSPGFQRTFRRRPPQLREETAEQASALLREKSGRDVEAVVQPEILDEIPQAPAPTRLRIRRRVDQSFDPARDERSGAHRARLQGDVHRAARKPPASDPARRLADGEKLGVSERIALALPAVVTPPDDFPAADDHGSDRHLADRPGLAGLDEGQLHPIPVLRIERAIHVAGSPLRQGAYVNGGTRRGKPVAPAALGPRPLHAP